MPEDKFISLGPQLMQSMLTDTLVAGMEVCRKAQGPRWLYFWALRRGLLFLHDVFLHNWPAYRDALRRMGKTEAQIREFYERVMAEGRPEIAAEGPLRTLEPLPQLPLPPQAPSLYAIVPGGYDLRDVSVKVVPRTESDDA